MRKRITLHEELMSILRAHGNRWMTTKELADSVIARGRYRKRDGTRVTAFQVHGRTRQYSRMFEREGTRWDWPRPNGTCSTCSRTIPPILA